MPHDVQYALHYRWVGKERGGRARITLFIRESRASRLIKSQLIWQVGVRLVATCQSNVVQAELDCTIACVLEAQLINPSQVTVELGDWNGHLRHAIADSASCQAADLESLTVVLLLCVTNGDSQIRRDACTQPLATNVCSTGCLDIE